MCETILLGHIEENVLGQEVNCDFGAMCRVRGKRCCAIVRLMDIVKRVQRFLWVQGSVDTLLHAHRGSGMF